MEKSLLRKVQFEELEIAKEIRRVCDENDIQYFLIGGTLLGAVRHEGFIPWDDDMDIGMLREDYEKFNIIANEKLHSDYIWQTWENDVNYPLPFGKVRKRGTKYIEGKGKSLKENGFYVDVFPYDYASSDEKENRDLAKKQKMIARMLLMKSGYKPWIDNGKVIWKKRIVYFIYQIFSLLFSHKELVKKYKDVCESVSTGEMIYEQAGSAQTVYIEKQYVSSRKTLLFENEEFKVPAMTEKFLEKFYGNYMELPPIDERENRHQIIEIDFGK